MNGKRVEQLLNLALVNLCEISVKGPATVPMGKAIEAVSAALQEAKKGEGAVGGKAMKDPGKKEEKDDAAAGDEVQ